MHEKCNYKAIKHKVPVVFAWQSLCKLREVCTWHLAFRQTVFTCRAFQCIMHNHDEQCMYVKCSKLGNIKAWWHNRSSSCFEFPCQCHRICSETLLKWHIIKFKGLMAHWMHRLVFNYSSPHPHLFRNYPSSAQISLFYSFRDGSEQRLQQIHFPEDKNSWQARSSPRAYRLACDTQAQLRADSNLEKELLFNQDGFPGTKSRKKCCVFKGSADVP